MNLWIISEPFRWQEEMYAAQCRRVEKDRELIKIASAPE